MFCTFLYLEEECMYQINNKYSTKFIFSPLFQWTTNCSIFSFRCVSKNCKLLLVTRKWFTSRLLPLVTARNEVRDKVRFLHLFVCQQGGSGGVMVMMSLSVTDNIYPPPPSPRQHIPHPDNTSPWTAPSPDNTSPLASTPLPVNKWVRILL